MIIYVRLPLIGFCGFRLYILTGCCCVVTSCVNIGDVLKWIYVIVMHSIDYVFEHTAVLFFCSKYPWLLLHNDRKVSGFV